MCVCGRGVVSVNTRTSNIWVPSLVKRVSWIMSDWSLLTDQAKTVNQRVECQDFPHLSVTYDHKQRLADAVGWTKVCFCLVVGGPPSAGARPLCVLGKHLLYVLCPSLLWFLSWGDLKASASPAFLHLCAGLLLCCDCSVQVSWPKCDMAIVCPLGERRAVFSHTLLARVQAQKTARTCESVDAQQRTCAMENPMSILISRTVQEVPMTTRASSFLQLCYQGKGRTQTIVIIVIIVSWR